MVPLVIFSTGFCDGFAKNRQKHIQVRDDSVPPYDFALICSPIGPYKMQLLSHIGYFQVHTKRDILSISSQIVLRWMPQNRTHD